MIGNNNAIISKMMPLKTTRGESKDACNNSNIIMSLP